jgi:hypothetical protein
MNAFASTTHYCKRRKKEPVSAENLPFDACSESIKRMTSELLCARAAAAAAAKIPMLHCHCHHQTKHTFKEIMARFKESRCNVNQSLLDVTRHPQPRALQREFTDEMDVYINYLKYCLTCKDHYPRVFLAVESQECC